MLFDAVFMGGLSIVKMFGMNPLMTLFSLIPMALMLACSNLVGKYMTEKWDTRQAAFSKLSDFSQESFSGIAVIKAFVKEGEFSYKGGGYKVEIECNASSVKLSVD